MAIKQVAFNSFSRFSYCRLERMIYICKETESQAIWHSMIQRMNTKMNTNMKTDINFC